MTTLTQLILILADLDTHFVKVIDGLIAAL